jgi:hypothetical protein
MTVMTGDWQPEIRKLALTSWGEGQRIIAVAGVEPLSGVSTLCEGLAAFAARSGRRTVLLEMARPLTAAASGWRLDAEPGGLTERDAAGFDRLAVAGASDGRSVTDIARLRRGMDEHLAGFDTIVADIAPLRDIGTRAVDGPAAAAACGRIYLVALAGQIDRAAFAATMSLLDASRITLAGLILNDRANPTLAAELAREAGRLRILAPRLSRWLARKALESRFLSERT